MRNRFPVFLVGANTDLEVACVSTNCVCSHVTLYIYQTECLLLGFSILFLPSGFFHLGLLCTSGVRLVEADKKKPEVKVLAGVQLELQTECKRQTQVRAVTIYSHFTPDSVVTVVDSFSKFITVLFFRFGLHLISLYENTNYAS